MYNYRGNFRKNITYLLHSAVAVAVHLSHLKSEIRINMRIRKNDARTVRAGDIRNCAYNDTLLQNSYIFMKNIRGTVAYFRNQLYNLLAMFKALGPSSIFMTFSADDLHWPELSMTINGVCFYEAEKRGNCFDSMRKDPLLTAIHFERRFKALMKYVFNGKQQPLGEVTDYFALVEFQNRGSPQTSYSYVFLD